MAINGETSTGELMSSTKTTIAILGMCAAIAACTSPQQRVENKEDMMSARRLQVSAGQHAFASNRAGNPAAA